MDRNQKAFDLWGKGQLQEAIQLLFQDIEDQPATSDSHYNLATILILAKNYEDAKTVLDTAMSKFPESSDLLYAYGNLYYQQKKYQESLSYFIKVFEDKESYLINDASIMIGQTYLAIDNPKKAVAYLLAASDRNQNDNTLLLMLGNCFLQLGSFAEARTYFEKVLALSPANDEAVFKRGLTGMLLRENPEIYRAYFKKSEELNPEKHRERVEQIKAIEKSMNRSDQK